MKKDTVVPLRQPQGRDLLSTILREGAQRRLLRVQFEGKLNTLSELIGLKLVRRQMRLAEAARIVSEMKENNRQGREASVELPRNQRFIADTRNPLGVRLRVAT